MNALSALQSFSAVVGSIPNEINANSMQSGHTNGLSGENIIQFWDNVPADTIIDAFERKFELTQCQVTSEDIKGAPAVYTNFTISPGEGNPTFSNEITLKKNRDSQRAKLSLIHEKLHAIQWNTIPELHASPYNQLTFEEAPVILSPKSWVLMTLLTERDAYAKTAWLAHLQLGQKYCEKFAKASANEFVSQDDVAYWHSRFPDDIGFALGEASLVWDQKKNVAGTILWDHYIDLALKAYENSYRWNKKSGAAKPVFVDLDEAGILALGASFGPSIFGKYYPDPVFLELKLSPKQQDRLDKLNAIHGIDPAQTLPTLDEALGALGSDRAAFIARSKAYIDREAEPSLKAEPASKVAPEI